MLENILEMSYAKRTYAKSNKLGSERQIVLVFFHMHDLDLDTNILYGEIHTWIQMGTEREEVQREGRRNQREQHCGVKTTKTIISLIYRI